MEIWPSSYHQARISESVFLAKLASQPRVFSFSAVFYSAHQLNIRATWSVVMHLLFFDERLHVALLRVPNTLSPVGLS